MFKARNRKAAGTNSNTNASGNLNKSSSSTGSSGSPSSVGHGSSSHQKPVNKSKNQLIMMTKWRWIIGFCCLLIIAYFGYIGYLETRVNTPFDAKKVKKKIVFPKMMII